MKPSCSISSRRRARAIALLSVLCFAVPATGCGGDESTESVPAGEAVGTFNGQFIIQNTAPPVGVTVTFSIDADGTFSGQTQSTNPETMGEHGVLSGTISGSDPLSLDLDVLFESPSGNFQLTGKCLYDEGSATLNGPALTAKDESGTFIGNAPLTATQE